MESLVHHEYAKLFPVLSDEALRELADDIEKNGLRNPIVLDENEQILDGRNRSAACILAGVKPVFEKFIGTDEQKLAFVVSSNVHRRHLTTSQRASVAAKLLPIYEQQAAKRQKSGKKNLKENLPEGSSGQSRDKAGAAMNVSGKAVDMAAKVHEKAIPEIVQSVESGELAVSAAAIVADMPEETQREIVLKGGAKEVKKAAAAARKDKPVPMRLESGFDDVAATKRIRTFVESEIVKWPEDRIAEAIQVFQLYLGNYEL